MRSWLASAVLAVFILVTSVEAGEYCGNGQLPQQESYILGASWGEASEVGRLDRQLPSVQYRMRDLPYPSESIS